MKSKKLSDEIKKTSSDERSMEHDQNHFEMWSQTTFQQRIEWLWQAKIWVAENCGRLNTHGSKFDKQ
jgi:hypothetical protein